MQFQKKKEKKCDNDLMGVCYPLIYWNYCSLDVFQAIKKEA